MTVKKIVTDGLGVAVLVDVARKVEALLEEHNVMLGVLLNEGGDDGPLFVVQPLEYGQVVAASIARSPQLWAITHADQEDE